MAIFNSKLLVHQRVPDMNRICSNPQVGTLAVGLPRSWAYFEVATHRWEIPPGHRRPP